jgi:hypothetical protein
LQEDIVVTRGHEDPQREPKADGQGHHENFEKFKQTVISDQFAESPRSLSGQISFYADKRIARSKSSANVNQV